jgi:hypothetical protein
MMLSGLISWLIVVLIVCLLYWVITQFAPAPIHRIVLVVCIVIIVLALIFLLLPLAGLHPAAFR